MTYFTAKQPLCERLDMDKLWQALGECLTELSRNSDQNAVLILQPAVEAFFLVHAGNTTIISVEIETSLLFLHIFFRFSSRASRPMSANRLTTSQNKIKEGKNWMRMTMIHINWREKNGVEDKSTPSTSLLLNICWKCCTKLAIYRIFSS